jgi:hypothetical protein
MRYVIVERRIGGEIVDILETSTEFKKFKEEYRDIVSKYPFPEYNVCVLGTLENPRSSFGELKGCEIARRTDNLDWIMEDIWGW